MYSTIKGKQTFCKDIQLFKGERNILQRISYVNANDMRYVKGKQIFCKDIQLHKREANILQR